MQDHDNEKHDEKAGLVRRWIEEGWNKGHTEVASEIFAPDYVHHEAVTPAVNVGIERIKRTSTPTGAPSLICIPPSWNNSPVEIASLPAGAPTAPTRASYLVWLPQAKPCQYRAWS